MNNDNTHCWHYFSKHAWFVTLVFKKTLGAALHAQAHTLVDPTTLCKQQDNDYMVIISM